MTDRPLSLGRLAALVGSAVVLLGVLLSGRQFLGGEGQAPPPLQSLHVRYRGVFQYNGKAAVWDASESVRVLDTVLARVMKTERLQRRPCGEFRRARRRRVRCDARSRTRALGPDWHYQGTLGLARHEHVYVRARKLPLTTSSARKPRFTPVAVPAIRRGTLRLIPASEST